MQDQSTRIPDPSAAVELPNDREAISGLINAILDEASAKGVGEASVFAIRLALEEAITNAFEHGHKTLDESTPISVEYKIGDGQVLVAIEDRGPGFAPGALPDPTLDENLDKPSGRGVMLMRAYMTDVEFNARGNRVLMRYTVPG